MFLILIGLLTFVITAEVSKDIKPTSSPAPADAAPVSQTPTTVDDSPKGCYEPEPSINPRILCVKCYDKFRTKDCDTQTCTCKCTGGTEYTTTKNGGNSDMASRDDIPCACRDKCGNFDPDASYKAK